jgi:transposase InsO family protein
MMELVKLLFGALRDRFRSRGQLEAENMVLRHQLNILRRQAPQKPRLLGRDRALFAWLYRLRPSVLSVLSVVQPETVVRWHRAGWRAWWRWKSRNRGGRPAIDAELRALIRQMCRDNPLWGAPRIHGELLKLGFDVAQSTISKYMPRRSRPPSQGWKTFLRNHSDGIASIDLFAVPTIAFESLYVFVVLGHQRRRILWFGITRHPTAEWLARQITEAFPWNSAPSIVVRDNDRAFGEAFRRRVASLGIRDHPIAPHSPWQNGHVERAIGSIRRECLDHMIVFGETHLQHLMAAYARYYNSARTHLSLGKDAPMHRAVSRRGSIVKHPWLGGLHHQYARI